VSINISSERVVPIGQAPRHFPGRPNQSTVYRWLSKGVRGATLETVVVGGKRFTSVEAIERFVEKTTANSPGSGSGNPVSRPTTRQAEARLHRAERDLDAAGI